VPTKDIWKLPASFTPLWISNAIFLPADASHESHPLSLRRLQRRGQNHLQKEYLWLPSPELAIRRIRQRVKMGGHGIPEIDVRRRFKRSAINLIQIYAPLADTWQIWDNRTKPPSLLLSSEESTLGLLKERL